MTGITPDGIEIQRDLAAPPAAVFDAWTKPENFARWFGGPDVLVPLDSLDFIAEPGRDWTAQMVLPDGNVMNWAGDFVEVAAPERLVFTITDRPTEPIRAAIVVELTATEGGTRMRFAQETPGFGPDEQAQVRAGRDGFINELEKIAEG